MRRIRIVLLHSQFKMQCPNFLHTPWWAIPLPDESARGQFLQGYSYPSKHVLYHHHPALNLTSTNQSVGSQWTIWLWHTHTHTRAQTQTHAHTRTHKYSSILQQIFTDADAADAGRRGQFLQRYSYSPSPRPVPIFNPTTSGLSPGAISDQNNPSHFQLIFNLDAKPNSAVDYQ